MDLLRETIEELLMESSKDSLSSEISSFSSVLRNEYGAELWMHIVADGDQYEPAIVSIDSIVFPKDKRNEGSGTAMMGEVISWANRNSLILSLDPSSDFGGSVSRLRKFYRRFGFAPNKGRKKDFRTRNAMIRYPRT